MPYPAFVQTLIQYQQIQSVLKCQKYPDAVTPFYIEKSL